jgi:hypothetical protein
MCVYSYIYIHTYTYKKLEIFPWYKVFLEKDGNCATGCFYGNSKAHKNPHSIHCILNQLNAVHTVIPHFSENYETKQTNIIKLYYANKLNVIALTLHQCLCPLCCPVGLVIPTEILYPPPFSNEFHPLQPTRLDNRNNIRGRIQITQLLITQSSPASCYFTQYSVLYMHWVIK